MFSPIVAIFSVIRSRTERSSSRNGWSSRQTCEYHFFSWPSTICGADVLRLLLDGARRASSSAFFASSVSAGIALDVDVERARPADLDRQVADELLELVGPGDEVRLAVDLDQDADAAAGVDVARDEALAGVAAGLLRGRGETPLAKQGDGLVEVAVGLDERVLAVHEAGAGALAQLLDARGRDVRHVRSGSPVSVRGRLVAAAGAWFGCGDRRALGHRARRISRRRRLLLLGGFAGELRGDLLGRRLGRGRARHRSAAAAERAPGSRSSSSRVRLERQGARRRRGPRRARRRPTRRTRARRSSRPPARARRRATARSCWPSMQASATSVQSSRIERIASSLAGMMWSISSGSTFVSPVRDDRDLELVRLGDRDPLAVRVDDEDRARDALHLAHAADGQVELVHLVGELRGFLLRHPLEVAGLLAGLELLEQGDPLLDRREVGRACRRASAC